MRILYTAMKDDYGDPSRGPSFEQCAFHDTLVGMGCDVLHYDTVAAAKQIGPQRTTRRLRAIVDAEKPDLLFSVLFTDELDRPLMRRLSDETDTPTVNWFCDDHWRFDDYSADWAPCFNHVVTTAASAVPKYHALRGVSMIKSQWAANPFTYRRLFDAKQADAEMKHDISFVGLPHGNRRAIVEVLRHAGLTVDVFGHGWDPQRPDRGRIDQARMIEVFNTSRINLNLSNASTVTARGRGPHAHDPWPARLDRIPRLGRYAVGAYRRALRLRDRLHPAVPDAALGPDDIDLGGPQQIKGRNFEVPGCGGFLLSGEAQELDRYYDIGKEIETFATLDELIDKARHHLAHDDARRAIADAGHARTLNEHTWVHRFHAVFSAAGLSPPPVENLLAPPNPGTTRELK